VTPDTRQLTLDDLIDLGAEVLHDPLVDPLQPGWRDLRGQGLTAAEFCRMADVPVVSDYL
jgi:hypothetical protein